MLCVAAGDDNSGDIEMISLVLVIIIEELFHAQCVLCDAGERCLFVVSRDKTMMMMMERKTID